MVHAVNTADGRTRVDNRLGLDIGSGPAKLTTYIQGKAIRGVASMHPTLDPGYGAAEMAPVAFRFAKIDGYLHKTWSVQTVTVRTLTVLWDWERTPVVVVVTHVASRTKPEIL